MVKVDGKPEYNQATKTVKVSLFADTKNEVNGSMKVVGLMEGYTLDAGSSVMTADKEFGFLDSTGNWHW